MLKKILLAFTILITLSGCSSIYEPGKVNFNPDNHSIELNKLTIQITDPNFILVDQSNSTNRVHFNNTVGSAQTDSKKYLFGNDQTFEALYIVVSVIKHRGEITYKRHTPPYNQIHSKQSFFVGNQLIQRIENETSDSIVFNPTSNVEVIASRISSPNGIKRSIDDAINIVEK